MVIRRSRVRVLPAPPHKSAVRGAVCAFGSTERPTQIGVCVSSASAGIPACVRVSAMTPVAQQTQLSCEDSLVTALPDARARPRVPCGRGWRVTRGGHHPRRVPVSAAGPHCHHTLRGCWPITAEAVTIGASMSSRAAPSARAKDERKTRLLDRTGHILDRHIRIALQELHSWPRSAMRRARRAGKQSEASTARGATFAFHT